MKKHAIWTLAGVLLIGALALAACGPQATPTPEVTEPPATEPATEAPATKAPLTGTVTLWHGWKESEIASLNDVIAGFQGMHPEVTIDVLYTPFDDLRGKFETAAATGEGPDLLIGPADWGPALYVAELIGDVSMYASEDLLASINSAALGAVQYQGALIGLPHTIKGVVLFRNASLIPDAPATWDDLAASAQSATAGDAVGADLEYGFFFSAAHLTACGGSLMDANGDPTFNNEAGVCWVNLLSGFKDVGPTEYYTDNDVNLFKTGNAGFIIDGSWNTSALAEAIGADNLKVDPWPAYGDSHLSGYVQTENVYLSANAAPENLDAAWAFVEYLFSPEAQAVLADPTKAAHIPAVSGVAISDRLMQETVAAFDLGTVFPVIPEMGAYWGPMDTALKSVFDEGADPAAALQTAFDSVTAGIQDIRSQ